MIIIGDALTELKKLESESVQCCVTSPPYWGLRDYGTATWVGGDSDCDHIQRTNTQGGAAKRPCSDNTIFQYQNSCSKCGATRTDSQLGLEKTPDCGLREFMKLRPDLTEDELKYVAQELRVSGCCDE